MTIPIVPLVLIVLCFLNLALGQAPDRVWSKIALTLAVFAIVAWFIGVTPEQIASLRSGE